MNGFNIYKKNDFIKSFQNKAGIFKMLIEDSELEVFESRINPGKSIICQPYESENSINIFFVLKGKLFHTNGRKIVNSGDRITFKNLEITHHLSVLEESTLLTIRNSKHFLKQANATNLVYDLIHKIQEKDDYTEEHCNNAGNLAVQIATIMALPEKIIENILHASKIHDVGKINTPTEILNKPSPLTPSEFEIVKQHSKDGFNIVMDTLNNHELATIVLNHHERLDGSGYPNGLKDDEISIESRILAVTDSFDAMVSKRPYKNSRTEFEALEDIKSSIGKLYDLEVVNALEYIVNNVNTLRGNINDK